MRKFTYFAILLLSLSTIFVSCTKKEVDQLTTQVMTANVATSGFTAKEVVGQSDPNPNASWAGKTEVTITGSDGSKYISVAIMDWNETNPTLDYNFNYPNATAIGGYNSGSGSDDIIASGTLHLTKVLGGVYLEGNFDVITQLGVHITNGYFYAKIK